MRSMNGENSSHGAQNLGPGLVPGVQFVKPSSLLVRVRILIKQEDSGSCCALNRAIRRAKMNDNFEQKEEFRENLTLGLVPALGKSETIHILQECQCNAGTVWGVRCATWLD